MSTDEIIKDLEQQIENLKMVIKLQEEIINLYKNKQPMQLCPSVWTEPIKPYTGDIIPNPIEITS